MRVEKLELSWINTVKAICMFTVFLNHSEYYYGYETPVIGPIYRPLFVNSFFFLSGYLLFRKQWSVDYMHMSIKEWMNANGGGAKH